MQLNTTSNQPSTKSANVRPEYLGVVETAKIIRKHLKARFPSVKASVRSDKYAGGASIRINVPASTSDADLEAMQKAVEAFNSRGFDGMIDLSFYKHSWLLSDGSAVPARSQGTTDCGGYAPSYDYPAPEKDARLVSFGSNYVFVNRDWS
jgi:hypothetical protein